MTDEVGAITGALTLSLEPVPGAQSVRVAYEGASDLYTVEGSPVSASLSAEDLVAHLSSDPGLDEFDNPMSSTLLNLRVR
jgi:hypothetical protein